MRYRSNRESIDNPTFNKLLEKAKGYQHLIEVNEQAQPQTGNAVSGAQPQTQKEPPATKGQAPATTVTTAGPANDKKDTPQEEAPKGPAADQKSIAASIIVANNILGLLGAFVAKSPNPRALNISPEIAKQTTMNGFIALIKQQIDGFRKDLNGDGYKELAGSVDAAMTAYTGLLTNDYIPGYNGDAVIGNFAALTKEASDSVDEVIKKAIQAETNRKEDLAKFSSKDGGEKAGFGDFIDFKTFESSLLEDNRKIEKTGEDSIEDLDGLYQIAKEKSEAGKDKGFARIRRKLFRRLINDLDELMKSDDVVIQDIKTGTNNPTTKDYSAYKMSKTFSDLGAEMLDFRAQIAGNDPESIYAIETLLKRFKSLVSRYNKSKLEYDDQLDLNIQNDLAIKDNPKFYKGVIAANDVRDRVIDFKLKGNNPATPVAKPAAKPVGTETKQGGLVIKQPILYGKGTRAKFNQQVKDFQALVISKFENVEPYRSSPVFKRFKSQGGGKGDGLFGPMTGAIVASVRKGFGFPVDPNKLTIDQELVDRLKGYQPVIKESRNFGFKFLWEQFDASAAKQILDDFDTGKSYISKKKSSTGVTDPNKPPTKTISNESVKDDKITSGDKKKVRDAAVGMGAKGIADSPTRSAVAEGKGIRFYGGDKALRLWDSKMGTVDWTKKIFISEDNPKDTEDLAYLIKNEIPLRYTRTVKRIREQIPNIIGTKDKEIDLMLFKRLTANWDASRIQFLSFAYTLSFGSKREYKINNKFNGRFYNDFENVIGAVDNPNYREKFKAVVDFWEKWKDVLKEYDEKIDASNEQATQDKQEAIDKKESEDVSSSMD